MLRWSWRMFRKEWRQQALVLSLVTVAVAASVTFSTVAMNSAGASQPEFGTAGAMSRLDVSDAAHAKAALASAVHRFGTVEVIGHTPVHIPGVPTPLDLRAQAPSGHFGRTQIRLIDGRYPTAADEVALTRDIAGLLDVGVGDHVKLGRTSRHVVGLVENPSQLKDRFGLVAPALWTSATGLTLLFDPTSSAPGSDAPGRGAGATGPRTNGSPSAEDSPLPVMVRGNNGPVAVLVLIVVAMAMALVGLIAAAGFVVVAQRRQRQLGLLAAIGATPRHLRLVVVSNGAIVGGVAAVLGGALGVLGWILAAPSVEQAFGHRIGRLDLPWGVIAGCLVVTLAMAVVAAWWPARRVARIPVIAALSGRPPKPTPVHRSTMVAVVLLVAGVWAIATALPPGSRVQPMLLIAGVIAVAFGTVFVAPAAIRAVALPARHLPFSSRLAVRDLARFQARAASALAAVAFAIGISVTIVVIAQANQYRADEGNLPANQMLVRLDRGAADQGPAPVLTAAQVAILHQAGPHVTGAIPGATVIPLEEAKGTPSSGGQVPPVSEARQIDAHSWNELTIPVVATPEVRAHLGIDPTTIHADTDLITGDDGDVVLLDPSTRAEPKGVKVQHVDLPSYFAAPHALITEGAMKRHGWTSTPSGWLVDSPRPLTTKQIAAARRAAGEHGLTIETRISQDDLATFRMIVTLVGALLVLAIVAMTVGLIRTESAREVRTLTATGASSGTRRAITASTAGALALLGVLLGTAGAYVALLAGFHADLGRLLPLPWSHLLVLVVGLPLLASAAGWLLAGRDPKTFSRQTFD